IGGDERLLAGLAPPDGEEGDLARGRHGVADGHRAHHELVPARAGACGGHREGSPGGGEVWGGPVEGGGAERGHRPPPPGPKRTGPAAAAGAAARPNRARTWNGAPGSLWKTPSLVAAVATEA